MSIFKEDIDQLQRAALASLHEHWKFYLIEGIILVALGAAAVAVPQVATAAVTILLGWLFLISLVALSACSRPFGCEAFRAFGGLSSLPSSPSSWA